MGKLLSLLVLCGAPFVLGQTLNTQPVNKVSYDLVGKEEAGTTYEYAKVLNVSDITTGKYLIVNEENNVALDGSLTSDVINNNFSVTIADNKISAGDDKAVTITADSGKYAIQNVSGSYLYGTSGKNETKYGADLSEVSITIDSGEAHIVSNTSVLRFNAASGQMRFRFYKSDTYTNQLAVSLYKLGGESSGGAEEPGGGEEPGGDETVAEFPSAELAAWLVSKGVSNVTIPALTGTSFEHFAYTDPNGEYADYYYVASDQIVTDAYLDALRQAEWTIPETPGDYGYECIDPSQTVEVDVDDSYGYTDIYVYILADISGGGEDAGYEEGESLTFPTELLRSWLESMGANNANVPGFAGTYFYYFYLTEPYEDQGTTYDPYFMVVNDADVLNDYLSGLRNAQWNVADQVDEEGFYVCIDPTNMVEVDVVSDTDEEGSYTCMYVYVIGEQGEDPTPVDPDPVGEAFPSEKIKAWFEGRGVKDVEIPSFASMTYQYAEFDDDTEENIAAHITISGDSNVTATYIETLKAARWTSEDDVTFVDADKKVEMDVFTTSEGKTLINLYVYAELHQTKGSVPGAIIAVSATTVVSAGLIVGALLLFKKFGIL